MRVHGDDQRAEVPHAELPEALRQQLLELDVLDRLDLGGLEGRGAAADRQVHTAELRAAPAASRPGRPPLPMMARTPYCSSRPRVKRFMRALVVVPMQTFS